MLSISMRSEPDSIGAYRIEWNDIKFAIFPEPIQDSSAKYSEPNVHLIFLSSIALDGAEILARSIICLGTVSGRANITAGRHCYVYRDSPGDFLVTGEGGAETTETTDGPVIDRAPIAAQGTLRSRWPSVARAVHQSIQSGLKDQDWVPIFSGLTALAISLVPSSDDSETRDQLIARSMKTVFGLGADWDPASDRDPPAAYQLATVEGRFEVSRLPTQDSGSSSEATVNQPIRDETPSDSHL